MTIKIKSNLGAGIFSVLLGTTIWLLVPLQIGGEISKNYGVTSRTLPYGAALVLMVCGVGLIFQSLVLKKDKTKEFQLTSEAKAIAYMAVLVLYAFCFEYSFIAAIVFLGAASLLFMKSRKPLYYGVVIFLAIALYFTFTLGLNVTLR